MRECSLRIYSRKEVRVQRVYIDVVHAMVTCIYMHVLEGSLCDGYFKDYH